MIIEQAGPALGSVERLLSVLATMEPLEERLDSINDPLPEPVDL
ncbi:hypothetical protein [Brevundimonas sp.]|nr:hypothetical protein [Brevundimonas sp.]